MLYEKGRIFRGADTIVRLRYGISHKCRFLTHYVILSNDLSDSEYAYDGICKALQRRNQQHDTDMLVCHANNGASPKRICN